MTEGAAWDAVCAWLRQVHPDEHSQDSSVLFARYFSEMPSPIARIVGMLRSPEERGLHPCVRDRRRLYATLEKPEALSTAYQRRNKPRLWLRIVGTGQDEEMDDAEEEKEDILRQEAEADKKDTLRQEAQEDKRRAIPDKAPVLREEASGPLSTNGTFATLHRKYLEEIDDDEIDAGDGPDVAILRGEFDREILDRFVHGTLRVPLYDCDFDEQYDNVYGRDMQFREQMREETYFDDR
ncbi:hypothetical protein MVES1_002477 [Malassezia vespertilionis]|uniref:CCD97-like C-terminal domain-containing protein n=1 Tax=Malassezia vespertilionis TaxID=2020962 RepID=A0A2N1JA48_9BASI|nr:uncharacterized protein MVES1_002477 [Malassezia vespertilionis]PKI83427.1 hypothetical protein MVES_002340 [Malassezia vespertilionis]WFD07120.1 hypothetical protein MVES1_002477 [Malassezia vespertilionis]